MDVVLLDKFGDQVFDTPSEFGSAWVRESVARIQREGLRRRMRDLEQSLADQKVAFNQDLAEQRGAASALKDQLFAFRGRFSRMVGIHRSGISISWRFLLLVLIASGVWVPGRR
ncbi:hypothetical protein [Rhodospirillum sp. A1_3_36]|uniref:hypothetical protein n=1 Tax=Rhodospirillum sp. A1_3_36 TaxID=3391666 RepID=UPI0039A412B5